MTNLETTFYTSSNNPEDWMPIFNDKVAIRIGSKETHGDFGIFEVNAVPGGGVPMPPSELDSGRLADHARIDASPLRREGGHDFADNQPVGT